MYFWVLTTFCEVIYQYDCTNILLSFDLLHHRFRDGNVSLLAAPSLGPDWNIFTGCIGIKYCIDMYCTDIHGPHRMNPTFFVDSLTSPFLPQYVSIYDFE